MAAPGRLDPSSLRALPRSLWIMNTLLLNVQNAPEMVLTVDGWMRLEDEYIPRVCTRENGAAPMEAIKAQAVAARTFLLRAMRDSSSLGRTAPIQNSERFQT